MTCDGVAEVAVELSGEDSAACTCCLVGIVAS